MKIIKRVTHKRFKVHPYCLKTRAGIFNKLDKRKMKIIGGVMQKGFEEHRWGAFHRKCQSIVITEAKCELSADWK